MFLLLLRYNLGSVYVHFQLFLAIKRKAKTPEDTSNKVMHDNIPDKNRVLMI